MPYSEMVKLDALATYLLPDAEPPALYFFARSGFDQRLAAAGEQERRVHLVTPAELF
jgi:hypothetical protein